MSEFELITITYSFVLGLGVAQILAATAAALKHRRKRPLHWLPLAFAASIFLFHIQYWFVLFDYDAMVITDWTWATYAPFLGLAVILFLSGGIVLPSPGSESGDSLIEDFEDSGKLSLLFLAAYIVAWIPANAWGSGSWLSIGIWFNALLTIPLLLTYYASNTRLRNTSAVLFLMLQLCGLLFVWSTPGDVS